jgi:hypothetical protein
MLVVTILTDSENPDEISNNIVSQEQNFQQAQKKINSKL